jgi:hypothetical protein
VSETQYRTGRSANNRLGTRPELPEGRGDVATSDDDEVSVVLLSCRGKSIDEIPFRNIDPISHPGALLPLRDRFPGRLKHEVAKIHMTEALGAQWRGTDSMKQMKTCGEEDRQFMSVANEVFV